MPRLPGSAATAVVGVRPVIDDLVALLGEEGQQVLLQVVCRVVAADVNAHVRCLSGLWSSQSKMGSSVRDRLSS